MQPVEPGGEESGMRGYRVPLGEAVVLERLGGFELYDKESRIAILLTIHRFRPFPERGPHSRGPIGRRR